MTTAKKSKSRCYENIIALLNTIKECLEVLELECYQFSSEEANNESLIPFEKSFILNKKIPSIEEQTYIVFSA